MKRRAILRLNFDPEEANRTKKARREYLDMNVIELFDGLKAEFLRYAWEIILAGDDIDGEPEKVLTVGVTSHGTVLFDIAIPAGKSQRLVELLQDHHALKKPLIDREELPEHPVRGGE